MEQMKRGYRFGNGTAWSWGEVAVLEAILRLGVSRHRAARLLRRGYNQVAGACHRHGIKVRTNRRAAK